MWRFEGRRRRRDVLVSLAVPDLVDVVIVMVRRRIVVACMCPPW
jgi:hypothetical protein